MTIVSRGATGGLSTNATSALTDATSALTDAMIATTIAMMIAMTTATTIDMTIGTTNATTGGATMTDTTNVLGDVATTDTTNVTTNAMSGAIVGTMAGMDVRVEGVASAMSMATADPNPTSAMVI